MSRIKFNNIKDVSGSGTSNALLLRLTGPLEALNKLKKMLTVTNKSMVWRVRKAKEKLGFWESREIVGVDDDVAAKIEAKIADLNQEIATCKPQVKVEYFEDMGDHLLVPAGFWWLAENMDGSHLSKLIEPTFVEGLRDYQIECLREMYKYNRATGVLATGLGKSLLIASICCATVKAGRRACVVVPTEYLVGQIYDTISKYVKNTKAYGGDRKALPLGADVLVVTAASAAKFITDYHTILIDESHHSPASTWVDLLSAAEKATHVYNFTATAMRADGLALAIHAFGGPVVYERDTRWGIANGWLKPLRAYMATVSPKRDDGSDLLLPDRMLAVKAYGALIKTEEVMALAKKTLLKALAANRTIIVLFKTVKAGEIFKKYCKPEVVFDVASSKYKKPLADFRDGKVNVLVSNDKLVSEGIDIKAADCLINLIQNSSDVITYQAVGRILRPNGATDALVFDITPNGYAQFSRAQDSRAAVYAAITDDISLVGK